MTPDLGDPYLYPDSPLWSLRRDQRAFLSMIPDHDLRQYRELAFPEWPDLHAGRFELLLRTTAHQILDALKDERKKIEKAADDLLRQRVHERTFAIGEEKSWRLVQHLNANTDTKMVEEAMHRAMATCSDDMHDALIYCAWADAVADTTIRE
jgi:hypothetical protein